MEIGTESFQGTGRFRLERCLGRGANGVVYAAKDLKAATHVALKLLTNVHGGSLYRFKQEFRSLADLRHPNLVHLFELLSEREHWFFTMEMIEGENFRDYVCRRTILDPPGTSADSTECSDSDTHSIISQRPLHPGYDEHRLRASLRQLAEGIQAVHDGGKLHRDLKPSNVLVTPLGRVVVLDFGLVAEFNRDGLVQSMDLLGTPIYMSPEQSAGLPLGAPSDWYTMGLMLYEVLVGALPFSGPLMTVLREKETWQPATTDFPRDTPDDLVALCTALLHLDPQTRLAGTAVLERLTDGASPPPARPLTRRASGPKFVGRHAHLHTLSDAFQSVRDGSPATVLVHGSSGIGKTTLVRHFLSQLEESEFAVATVEARCFERESVPYKGLDSLVDGLVHRLRVLDPVMLQAVLPREMAVLERLFPVTEEFAASAIPFRAVKIADVWELRKRGARALRELLSRLADVSPLVLFIDDVQWGDVDSAQLLREILSPPDPPVLLLVLAFRTEERETSEFIRTLMPFLQDAAADLGLRELRVGEMSGDETRELVYTLVGTDSPARGRLAQIAEESEGIPFFVEELALHDDGLARHGASITTGASGTLDDVISLRLSQLEPASRNILEVLAAAGRPIEREVLVNAVGTHADPFVLDMLRDQRLIRARRAADRDEIEVYHARMARTVLALLDPEILKERHLQLATAIRSSGSGDAETLFRHYYEAGETGEASTYAVAAAQEASKALAFNRAAELYGRALECREPAGPSAHRLRVALAHALASAGRGEQAGRAYLAAAQDVAGAENLELQQRAIGQFFRAGRFDEGLAALRDLLPALRLTWPESAHAMLRQLLLRRLQLRFVERTIRRRPAAPASSDDLLRIDACYSIATGLSVVEPVRARLFQTEGLIFALKSGDPMRMARAATLEASFGASVRVSRDRTEALFTRAEHLVRQVDSEEIHNLLWVARGIALYLYGDWKAAVDSLSQAENRLAEHSANINQELDNARVFLLASLTYLGELNEVRARLPALLNDARARGDLYAHTMFTLRECQMHLAADDVARARKLTRDTIAQWSRAGFHAPHYAELQRQVEFDLYEEQPVRARQRMVDGWRLMRKTLFLRNRIVFVETTYLTARTCVAVAAAGIDQRLMLKQAARAADKLQREETRWTGAVAMLLRAGILATEGAAEKAQACLETAERYLNEVNMPLHAATARYRRGQLLGGPLGTVLMDDAAGTMRRCGVSNPSRMAVLVVPGRF
jgi:serine/threonine protein kinase